MSELIKKDINNRMDSTISSLKTEMNGIRAGRASPSMLDTIKVDVYGSKMPINQIGNITTPEPRLINIEIWDKGRNERDIEDNVSRALAAPKIRNGKIEKVFSKVTTKTHAKDVLAEL